MLLSQYVFGLLGRFQTMIVCTEINSKNSHSIAKQFLRHYRFLSQRSCRLSRDKRQLRSYIFFLLRCVLLCLLLLLFRHCFCPLVSAAVVAWGRCSFDLWLLSCHWPLFPVGGWVFLMKMSFLAVVLFVFCGVLFSVCCCCHWSGGSYDVGSKGVELPFPTCLRCFCYIGVAVWGCCCGFLSPALL